jgi:hypothetical protein
MPDALRQCFVISPIGQEGSDIRRHADEVLKHIIVPAMAKCEIKPVRSDDLSTPGRISEQMFQHLLRDDLCIALLTGNNPNVFYELAIAHSARRPVIIMAEKGTELPFDITDLRCVFYDLWPSEIIDRTYVNLLVAQIEQIKAANWIVPPVSAEFRQQSDDDPSNPARTHSRQLCEVIGLRDAEPVETELFQSFEFDIEENRNPVANLWADPQPGNFIRANLDRRNGMPVLRVMFASTSDSLAPAVAIHPNGLVARRMPAQSRKLVFKAALVVSSDVPPPPPLVVGVRVVDGYAEHWRFINRTTEGLQQMPLTPDFADYEVHLDAVDVWRPFGGAGKQEHPARAQFKVIASLVLQFGSARAGIELGPGEGIVDIAAIRFQ